MLRSFVIGIATISFVGGLAGIYYGAVPPGWVFAIWGGILLIGILFERFRYKSLTRKIPPNAVRTNERFVDDETGKTVTVYVDPATGERTYVAD